MAAILFIAPADLGETVLATGALAHVLREGDAVTVLAGADAAPLFRSAPAERVAIPERGNVAWALAARIAGKRYDVAIDARGGWLGRLAPATRVLSLEPAAVLRHRVEDWGEAAGVSGALAPVLWLDDTARAEAATVVGEATQILVLAPGGARDAKRWPAERFAAVARRLATGPLNGALVLVIGAAERDTDITREIVQSLDADGVLAANLGASLDLLGAAALMERATLVIGNDNVLSHIAGAAGAPTLTVFGPTDERVRAPYGPRTRTLRGRSLEELAAQPYLDAGAAMEDVSIDAVEAAAIELLHAGGLR
jgi:ADP-heptose:LPS heptosyltransferase